MKSTKVQSLYYQSLATTKGTITYWSRTLAGESVEKTPARGGFRTHDLYSRPHTGLSHIQLRYRGYIQVSSMLVKPLSLTFSTVSNGFLHVCSDGIMYLDLST